MPLEPHEGGIIVLRDYVAWHYDWLEPWDFWNFPRGGYTVEIFWTKSHKNGLPLTGWSNTVILMLEEEPPHEIIELGPGWSTEMVNMEQRLKP